MEDKTKNEKGLKNKINELKKTTKGQAILKLFRWLIFFIALFIFILIASLISGKEPQNNNQPINNPQDEIKDNDVLDNNINDDNPNSNILTEAKIQELINNLKENFNYKIEIKINNDIYLFDGHKNREGDNGYKETKDGIIKYIIDSTGIYSENLIGREPITNLYEGLNEQYMNWDNFFKFINMEYVLVEKNVYHMASEVTDIYLTIQDNNITNIKIISKSNIDGITSSYDYTFKVGA
ncbi:MAG: hypothetical protein NC483_05505 [Ruminococcus sp.]|nr:hypothetical protein [Ruminococcus sp.]